jgi:hypothetical protein
MPALNLGEKRLVDYNDASALLEGEYNEYELLSQIFEIPLY